MPYSVDRYRSNAFSGQPGWPLTVNDGNIVSNATSLKLLGKSVPNYGEFIAENFVHILENFAGDLPPENPITGQLWYDIVPSSTNGRGTLKIYNGIEFTPITGGSSGTTFPERPNIGQIFLLTNRLFIYDGTNWIPIYHYSQGTALPSQGEPGDIFFNQANKTIHLRVIDGGEQWIKLLYENTSGIDINSNISVKENFYLSKSIKVLSNGGPQSSPVILKNNINIIKSTSILTGDSVRFDISANVPLGTEITVLNKSPSNLQVFPHTGGRIDDFSVDTPYILPAETGMMFIKATSSDYYSLSPLAHYG